MQRQKKAERRKRENLERLTNQFSKKHKLDLTSSQIVNAHNEQRLQSFIMKKYDESSGVRKRNKDIEILLSDLESLERLEESL